MGVKLLKYKYRVRDAKGKIISGNLEAENKNLIIESLLGQGYFIMNLEEVKESKEVKLEFSFMQVSTRELVVMTRQLATMMAAGLSILRCFKILAEQTASKKLRAAVQTIGEDIEGGTPLWEAIARHPHIFTKIYISMIRAGELGGVLDSVLERLGDHLEREQEINSKVKSASIYPTIISIFAVLVVFFIITFVMPTFVSMFESAGAVLPLPTQILLTVGLTLKRDWVFIFIGVFILIGVIRKLGKTSQGRLFYDTLFLHIPIIGKTISRITVARFCRTMGTLVRSGIPVLQALEVTEDVVGNEVISRAIRKARASIKEGDTITAPLVETGVFEPMVTQMIAVGEETGALDEMLIRMSDYFEREVMYMVDAMMAIIEPLLIMMVAVLVGGVVVATLLPMFDMMNLVGG